MVGAVVGGLLSDRITARALLTTIGLTLLFFGIDLLRSHAAPPTAERAERPNVRAAVVAGALIGLLGGFVGLILGALRLPALLRFVGLDAFRVVGTNAAVGFCLGVAGVFGHLSGGVDWTLLGIGAATSVPGSILGATLTGRLDERQLLRAVGVVLLIAGSALLVQAAV
jgi:uncharacterized membrane protein YfcA